MHQAGACSFCDSIIKDILYLTPLASFFVKLGETFATNKRQNLKETHWNSQL